MAISVFISTHNPYPDYTTKYQVMRDVNTQISPDFNTYNEAAAWAASHGYCVISGSMGWNYGGNPPCPATTTPPVTSVPSAPLTPSTVTISIGVLGGGTVLSSGGDNALAQRTSITVPYNYKVYFEAHPASGWSFQKFIGSGGETTQGSFEVPAISEGSVTAVFTQITAPSPPTTTKPPTREEPETFYETYKGYTINTQGAYFHAIRPTGTGIGLYSSISQAHSGIDADILSLNPPAPPTTTQPPACPSGQYLDVSSPIPHCLPYPETPAEAGTPAYQPPLPPGSPTSCPSGQYLDRGTGKCLTLTPPTPQPQPQPQPPEKPKDLTGLYLLAAAGIGAFVLLFGGKKR